MAKRLGPEPISLSILIRGERVTAERFQRAVDAFFGVLKEVTAAITGKAGSIEWVVSVRSGSIGIGAKGEAAHARHSVPVPQVVAAAYAGLRQIQESRARPKHFNDGALHDARELAQLVDGKTISAIRIRRSKESVGLQQEAVHNVDAMFGGTLSEDGFIEGKLEMISSRGGLHVGVWDALSDRQVRCYVSPQLLDNVTAAFGRRVAVGGTILYKPTGEPVSIDVETIEIFPTDEELPTAEDVLGILVQ
jgi:hypothetical protein